MSWQSYVDDQLISTKVIKSAVIAGHDGNIWASSAGFPVSAEELKALLGKYANTDQLAMNGVTIGGVKYMFLSATDRVVRAKKGTSGVHCIKTVQGTIICSFPQPSFHEQRDTHRNPRTPLPTYIPQSGLVRHHVVPNSAESKSIQSNFVSKIGATSESSFDGLIS